MALNLTKLLNVYTDFNATSMTSKKENLKEFTQFTTDVEIRLNSSTNID